MKKREFRRTKTPEAPNRSASHVEGANEVRGFFRAFPESVPKSENEKNIIDRNEFKEVWPKGMDGWNIENNISEEPVGDCHEMGNRELEEAQLNNA